VTGVPTQSITRCPGCGSAQASVRTLGAAALRRCRSCGLMYADRVADASAVYVDGYLQGATPFGIDVTHPVFQAYLAHAGSVRMRLVGRAVGRTGSLLDVGCGTGEVLAVARDLGWDVVGVEPVEDSAARARERGLDVRATTLEASGLPERSFDVVSAFHVVEHMVDALSFIRSISRFARPGGLVVVEVPNWSSVLRWSSGDGWMHLRPLEHVSHFSPRTLRATLARAGLEPVSVRSLSFVWDGQARHQQLSDLGLGRLAPILDRMESRVSGSLGTRPIPPAATTAVAHAVEQAYDRAGVGMVVFAVAGVPR